MLVELIGLELRKAADTFWLFSYGLVLLVLGKDCLRIFVSMFLDESFESHRLLPLCLSCWYFLSEKYTPAVIDLKAL